jgi:transposase
MDIATLPMEVQEYIQSLEENVKNADKAITSWEERYTSLEEQYKLLLLQKFGRKSEKGSNDPNQKFLFSDEADTEIHEDITGQAETITYSRKKPGRKPIDDSLPREDVIIDLPEEEKMCACGHEMVRIGEETSERLQVILPKMWVERIIRPKYACKFCEGSGDEDKPAVRIADIPVSIIPKSIVTPGLLAFIIVNKFVDHLPYYRQEKRFERIGIHLSRQNMSNWQQAAFEKIKPLIKLLKEHIRGGPVINMDETPVQVLNEPGRSDTSKSYMWLTRGGFPDKPAFLYSYRETRGSNHIRELTEGFKGYLQSDGYRAYETALEGNENIIHVGCMAHARRKFYEASKVSKKAGSAEEAMKFIRKLYTIEDTLRSEGLDENEFISKRKEQAKPVLKKFKIWLDKRSLQVPPSLKLGEAIKYTLNEWPRLIRYLESSYLTPDNNVSERAIRPFVLGRKNWLFSGSPLGAESSCAMYSLIETAKHNSLNPNDYLLKVFEDAPLIKSAEEWEALLPWNLKDQS